MSAWYPCSDSFVVEPNEEEYRKMVSPMPSFRGGLVFKAHRLLYHSVLGLRVIKKRKKEVCRKWVESRSAVHDEVTSHSLHPDP